MQRAEPADVKLRLASKGKSQPRRHDLGRWDVRVVAVKRSTHIIGLKVEELLGLMIGAGQTQRTGHLWKVAVVGHADKPRQKQLPGQQGGA
jgi:hypothetical protein